MAPEIDGFSFLSEIGRGGFGVVYRARQSSLGRWVAVKVLPDVRGDSESYGRFERECRALGAVSNHPSIATVYACGVARDGSGYLALELLDGGSLAQRSAAGPMDWTRAAIIGIALAGALETAHRVGVLHRDVKPQNVLFDRLGTPKLLDFGIASVPGAFQTRSAVVTLTLAHAAPEVVAGGRGTVASDVYALASTLFTVIHGSPPFNRDGDETLVPLLARIAAAPVPDLRAVGLPDDLASVLEGALAKDPAERPRSAEEFGMALAEVLAAHGGPSLVPPVLAPQLDDSPPELLPSALPVLDAATVARQQPPEPTVVTPLVVPPAQDARRSGPMAWIAAAVIALLVAGVIAHAARHGGGDPGATSGSSLSSPGHSTSSESTPRSSGSPSPSHTASTQSSGITSSSSTATRSSASHPSSSHPSGGAPPAPPPATPAAATANSVIGGPKSNGSPTQMKVTLSWDPSTGTTAPAGYEVERTTMAGSAATGTPTTLTFTTTSATIAVKSLDGSTQWYRWRVRAVDSGGHHSDWRSVSARIPNFAGRQGLVAVQVVRTAGLRGNLVETPTAKPRLKGRVTAQSPGAGLYNPGQPVTIDAYAR